MQSCGYELVKSAQWGLTLDESYAHADTLMEHLAEQERGKRVMQEGAIGHLRVDLDANDNPTFTYTTRDEIESGADEIAGEWAAELRADMGLHSAYNSHRVMGTTP